MVAPSRPPATASNSSRNASLPNKCRFSLFKLSRFSRSEQVGNVGPASHLQVLGDPFQAHRRFLAQPLRHPHFACIPFALLAQSRRIPSQPPPLLAQQTALVGG